MYQNKIVSILWQFYKEENKNFLTFLGVNFTTNAKYRLSYKKTPFEIFKIYSFRALNPHLHL